MAPNWDALGAWLLAQFSLLALIRDVAVLLGALWLAALVWAGIRVLRTWEGWPSRSEMRATAARVIGPLTDWPVAVLFGRSVSELLLQPTAPVEAERPRRWLRAVVDWVRSVDRDAFNKWMFRGFALAASVVGVWIFVVLWPLLEDGPPAEADRDQLLAYRVGLATIVALISLPLLFIRSWINERQTRTAERQVALAEKGNVTERIIKATELLGATHEEKRTVDGQVETATVPTIEVRIGAIYTLERVARESPEDLSHVFDAFSSYVRSNFETKCDLGSTLTEFPKTTDGEPWDLSECVAPSEDVAAALKAQIRLSANEDGSKVALRKSIWEEVPLCGGDFRDLFYAYNFEGPRINLSGARLECCNLWRADFLGGKFERTNFNYAYLRKAFFNDAYLAVAQFQYSDLTDAVFWGSDLSGAQFRGANLIGAKFFQEGAMAPVGLQQSSIEYAFGDRKTAEQMRRLGLQPPDHWSDVWITNALEAENAWISWKSRQV